MKIKLFKSALLTKGSTIIELLISVMIVGLIVTAVANAITHSIKNTGESRFRQNATILGQEVIEHLRSQRNSLGFTAFSNQVPVGEGCYPADLSAYKNSACEDTDAISMAGADFKRDTYITVGGSGVLSDPYFVNVTITVSWQDGANERKIELVQEFKQSSGFIN